MKLKVIGALASFFITILYITGCGREGKVLLTDNYKAQPIGLSHTENSNDGKTGTGFSTDVTKAKADFNVTSPTDFTKFETPAFSKNDVMDCRVKSLGANRLEVNVRFSNDSVGAFAATYVTEYDATATGATQFDSKELNRVSYQDSSRNSYLASTTFTNASCALRTALVNRQEIRGSVGCDLRGTDVTNIIQLSGNFSCHILGGI